MAVTNSNLINFCLDGCQMHNRNATKLLFSAEMMLLYTFILSMCLQTASSHCLISCCRFPWLWKLDTIVGMMPRPLLPFSFICHCLAMPFCGCVAEYCENVDWRPLNLLVPVHTNSLNTVNLSLFSVCMLAFFAKNVYWAANLFLCFNSLLAAPAVSIALPVRQSF